MNIFLDIQLFKVTELFAHTKLEIVSQLEMIKNKFASTDAKWVGIIIKCNQIENILEKSILWLYCITDQCSPLCGTFVCYSF